MVEHPPEDVGAEGSHGGRSIFEIVRPRWGALGETVWPRACPSRLMHVS